MKIRTLLVAGAMAMTASAVSADSPPAATASPAASDKNAADKVVCRTFDEIGSRIAKKRICLTRAQWRENAAIEGRGLEQSEALRSGARGG